MSDDFDEMPPDDARLLAAIARALGPDAPPPGLVARAEGLVAFMDVDRELVALLEDAAEPVGARGAVTRDRLAFELGDGSVSLELSTEGDLLVGQVLAGQVVEVVLEDLDREIATSSVDTLGRFSLRPAPAGPVRLRLEDGSGRPLVTDWFLV
jgi:hypothetical protein